MFKLDNELFQQYDWHFFTLLKRERKPAKMAIRIYALFVSFLKRGRTFLKVVISE